MGKPGNNIHVLIPALDSILQADESLDEPSRTNLEMLHASLILYLKADQASRDNTTITSEYSDTSVRTHDLLQNLCRELHTHIHAMVHALDKIEDSRPGQANESCFEVIKLAADRVKTIASNMQNRADHNEINQEASTTLFSIQKAIEDTIRSFSPSAKRTGNALSLKIDDNLPDMVFGDQLMFYQVCMNLISNAVKFTENGAIDVSLRLYRKYKDTYEVEITVADTGAGIPENKQAVILEDPAQPDPDEKRKLYATSQGLQVVKKLVEQGGGSIRVESKEGMGSKFTVVILLKQADKAVKAKSTPVQVRKGLKALIVEDHPINQVYIEHVLESWECLADVANDGMEALEKIENESYDLVLMDLRMPRMDGYQTTRIIRESGMPFSNIPIIALTAQAMKEEIQKCKDIGMNEYISKPFTPEDLSAKINAVFSKNPHQNSFHSSAESSLINIEDDRTGKAYNLKLLNSIFSNAPDALHKALKITLRDVTKKNNNLQECVETKQWENAGQIAHNLKSALRYIGANEAAALYEQIEHTSSQKEALESIADLAAQASEKTIDILHTLRKDFPELEKSEE